MTHRRDRPGEAAVPGVPWSRGCFLVTLDILHKLGKSPQFRTSRPSIQSRGPATRRSRNQLHPIHSHHHVGRLRSPLLPECLPSPLVHLTVSSAIQATSSWKPLLIGILPSSPELALPSTQARCTAHLDHDAQHPARPPVFFRACGAQRPSRPPPPLAQRLAYSQNLINTCCLNNPRMNPSLRLFTTQSTRLLLTKNRIV